MKFNIVDYHRGMHSLAEGADDQVLVRAKFKGLNVHPQLVAMVADKVIKKSYLSSFIHKRSPQR